MQQTTRILELSAHWASYLVNKDASGLTKEEKAIIDSWYDKSLRGYYCMGIEGEQYIGVSQATGLGGEIHKYIWKGLPTTYLKELGWEINTDYYNREVVKCVVYAKKFGNGTVYLMDEQGENGFGYTYTCSFGANSDRSYTGCFQLSSVRSIIDAAHVLDIKVNGELSGRGSVVIKEIVKSVLNIEL